MGVEDDGPDVEGDEIRISLAEWKRESLDSRVV